MNKFEMRLEKKVLCCDKLLHLYFKPINGEKIEFQAGQYLAIVVGRDSQKQVDIKRFYSIASAPGEEFIEFYVTTAPGGPGSQFFEAMKEGDSVQAMGPMGVFTYKAPASPEAKVTPVFVATGTGVAPFWSIVKDQLAKGNANEMQIIFGVRSEENLFLKDEIESLAAQHPNLKPTITLSQPGQTWQGAVGRVTKHLQDMQITPDMNFYLCGIKDMIIDAKKLLMDKGVPQEKIFTEMY